MKCRLEILNVANEQAFQALAETLSTSNTLPDIVVNNAGIAYLDSFANTTSEQWRRTLDVNVLGVVYGSRIFIGTTAAPLLKRLLPRALFRILLRSEARKIGYL